MTSEKCSLIEAVAKKFISLPDGHERDFILGFMEGVQAERAKIAAEKEALRSYESSQPKTA